MSTVADTQLSDSRVRLFRSVYGRLALIIAAALVPALVAFSWMVLQSYRNERAALERRIVGDAEALSRLVDSALDTREAVLRTLATANSLDSGDLEDFHRRAKRAVPGGTEWIVLADERGKLVVHTEHPFGTILPDGAGPYLAVTAAGKVFFSDLLLRGPATGKSVLFIAIPIQIGGRQFSLHYVMTAQVLTDILKHAAVSSGTVAAVIDRNAIVIARSRRIEEFLGASATSGVQAALAVQTSGKLYDRTLDGVDSVLGFCTSQKSGWTSFVAAPSAELFLPARKLLRVAFIALLAVGAIATLAAFWFASRLIRAVDTLVRGTRALAVANPAILEKTGIREMDYVVNAIRDAALQLRQRESELARSRDEALEASRVKDEFLATLSHELRTPLNPALLISTESAADPAHPAETRAAFSMIAKSVSLEARLIDDMLDVTRIGQGKLKLELKTLKIGEVLEDAVSGVRTDLVRKNVELHVDVPETPIWVLADGVRLQQVFWNLLTNAAKFSSDGSKVLIRVRLDREQFVEIAVTDTGIGMTAEELAVGFKRFEQGAHGRGGLGLGLAISKALVELHGGTISAASAGRNRGSTFAVRLPTVSAPEPKKSERAPTLNEPTAPGKAKILIIEDHEVSRFTLGRILARRGYESVGAATVGEAIALFQSDTFHFIITDIGLPDGDGYELFRTLQQIRPVVGIAVSGYGTEEDIRRSKAAGFVDHIVKPLTVAALNRGLERAETALAGNDPA